MCVVVVFILNLNYSEGFCGTGGPERDLHREAGDAAQHAQDHVRGEAEARGRPRGEYCPLIGLHAANTVF